MIKIAILHLRFSILEYKITVKPYSAICQRSTANIVEQSSYVFQNNCETNVSTASGLVKIAGVKYS